MDGSKELVVVDGLSQTRLFVPNSCRARKAVFGG